MWGFIFSLTQAFAPCKGIHDSLGFGIPPCGFRIPSTGFRIPAQWIPDSKKGWIPNFFSFLMLLFAFRFCVRILLYGKTLFRMHNKFVFFFDLQITWRNVLLFRKGLRYNNEGDIGGLSTPQNRGKKITNIASPQKNVAKHRHLVISREWDWPQDSIFHLLYFCELYFQICR